MRFLLSVLLALCALPSFAQDQGVYGVIEGRQFTPGGYYFNAQPGEPVTRVNVWGQVLRPGVYEVGPDFDLGSVLSLAGVSVKAGPADGDPDLVVRLYRSGEPVAIYDAPLSAFVRDDSPPALRYGDVIELAAVGVARVGVWGAVTRPGIYEVGPTFSARDVVALAGGPELQTLRPSESRETTVTIYGGASSSARYTGTLEDFLQGPPPSLEDGDVIQIESRLSSGWTTRDTLTVAGIATSAAIAVAQFLRLLNVD